MTPTWTDTPLWFPHVFETEAIELVRGSLEWYLAAAERRLGVPPRTIEPLAAVDQLLGNGILLDETPLPAAALGVFNTEGEPASDRDGDLDVVWRMIVQIVVAGTDATDTLARRSVYAMTIAELITQRFQPSSAEPGRVERVTLVDIDLQAGAIDVAGAPRTVADAELSFHVAVPKAIAGRPAFNPALPAGSPGGPPSEPYEVPVPWPAARPRTQITKEF